MTARIQRDFIFTAGVHFGDEFYTNLYTFDAQFNVESESIEEQNIALERIKYFLDLVLQHSIFVKSTNLKTIQNLTDAGLRVCTLPEEPYDQIIGIMLFHKLNAITEGRLIITDISITSHMSDGVTCFYSIEENTGPFKMGGWWDESSTKIADIPARGSKVIKIPKKNFDWEEFNLNWNSIKNNQDDQNQVVFVNFDKLDK